MPRTATMLLERLTSATWPTARGEKRSGALFHVTSRSSKSSIVDGNVALRLRDLNGEASVRARQCPAERDPHAVDVAIVSVIDLRRIPAEWGFRVTDHPQEQPRFS